MNHTAPNLPARCFAHNPGDGSLVIIRRGEPGYYPTETHITLTADECNEALGVSKIQAEAMLVGSMFGWNAPGADPAMYDENGGMK